MRRPRHRPQKRRWQSTADELWLALGVDGTPGGQARLLVDRRGAVHLEVPASEIPARARKPPRAWQQVWGSWAELEVEEASGREDRWRLSLAAESGLIGELAANHPLELSWGRRAGQQRGSVSGSADFAGAWERFSREER